MVKYDEMDSCLVLEEENNSRLEYYVLSPGVGISFNQIYTGVWRKKHLLNTDRFITLNYCLNGRCDVTFTGNRHVILKKGQVSVHTIFPNKELYCPGKLYEGIQLFIDLQVFNQSRDDQFLDMLGIDPNLLSLHFCSETGIYIREMNERLSELVTSAWNNRKDMVIPHLRYLTTVLIHDVHTLPAESESTTYFTQSQIAIVREAEELILSDLSRRLSAREVAERFGISESSLKLYIKGVLGDSYLSYFRRKRMEKAAELLEDTDKSIAEIASLVGYENQGKFAKVFFEHYNVTPLEFRRLSKVTRINS